MIHGNFWNSFFALQIQSRKAPFQCYSHLIIFIEAYLADFANAKCNFFFNSQLDLLLFTVSYFAIGTSYFYILALTVVKSHIKVISWKNLMLFVQHVLVPWTCKSCVFCILTCAWHYQYWIQIGFYVINDLQNNVEQCHRPIEAKFSDSCLRSWLINKTCWNYEHF